MELTEDMVRLLNLFEKHTVIYAVVGGFAVNYYGHTRETKNLDILILPSEKNALRIVTDINESGLTKNIRTGAPTKSENYYTTNTISCGTCL